MVKRNTKKTSGNEDFESISEEIDELEIEETEALSRQKIKKIKEELKRCKAEKQQYLDGWQREKADLLNIRKRQADELERIRVRTQSECIEKLLPLCDSFDMAMSNSDAWERADQSWRKGIEQIHTQLQNILTSYDVHTVGSVGEAFNPHLHEAVSSAPVSNEKEHQTIVTVYQKGYRAGENLVRPAKVIVGEYS